MMTMAVFTEGYNYTSHILLPKLSGKYLIVIFCISGLFHNKKCTNNRHHTVPFEPRALLLLCLD